MVARGHNFLTASVNYIVAYNITHLWLSGERESEHQDEGKTAEL